MNQVLCYEIICPVCHEIEYNPIKPQELRVCPKCTSTSNFRPFDKDLLEIMIDLPTLTGSRKQIIWANRLRLFAIKIQSNIELLGELLKITNSQHWIDFLKNITKMSEDEILNAIEEIKKAPPEKKYIKTLLEQARQTT